MLRFLFKTRPLRSLLLPSCHWSGRSSGVPSMQVNTLSVKWQLSAKLGQSHHEGFVKKTGCVGCIELHWAYRRLCVIKMLKKFHHSPPWVRLFGTLSPSFGFAAHSSSVIQTLTCFFFLLPTSFAGLLGYGYGEGSCAAYPFRSYKSAHIWCNNGAYDKIDKSKYNKSGQKRWSGWVDALRWLPAAQNLATVGLW